MRKSKQEAAETRERIVEAAAEFCRNGISATGFSDLMAAAGLTHGGFYRHFASKDLTRRRSLRDMAYIEQCLAPTLKSKGMPAGPERKVGTTVLTTEEEGVDLGQRIFPPQGRASIFGYTIFNDFSAHDAQWVEMEGRPGPAKGKSFDGGNVLGPWIVTPDEIGDPYRLKMEARVNGEVRSQGTTEGMLFSFEQIIARISRDETLMHGESIGSGTVGNECGLELGWFLEHGDCVELEVERSGC
jgi:Fumarylacetoacetate (FAA) hydrolase family/Bacterial regulatory proteins, tetR family